MGVEELLVQVLREQVAEHPKSGRRMTWVYGSLHELLLESGRFFTPAELPDSVGRLPARSCYANAFAVATVRRELTYVEGYAVWEAVAGNLLHIHHAWCVDAQGVVVDPTWPTPGLAYLGLPIGPQVGAPRLGPGLIEEMEMLYPVLEAGLPAGALVDVGRPVAQESVG
ncbi:hypothetical protein [Streptomyces sp. NPDC088360]|uniref:hypothetical protein n=1 Tax=Streptomyces sp. NPDC088360 TaxID=3154515 RepID=UPI00344B76EA